MYDLEVTSNYLSQIRPVAILQTKSGEKEIPFELQYHSPDEVAVFIDYCDSLINLDLYKKSCETSNTKVEFKPGVKLDEEVLIWMENERILCKWDCNYFLTRYYKYLDVAGKYQQFVPLTPQKVNMKILAKMQRLKRAIRKWTVKARQQGETTWSQGIILHRLAYFADIVSMVASKDSDSSGEMGKKFTNAMNLLPYWNRPFLKSFRQEEEYTYANGSNFDLGYGTQDSLGRGRTPLVAHLSEIPFYKYPEKAIEESLINAMHETIWLLQLFEGTAEVRDDYFHKKTKEIIAGMEKGTTSLVFCFHPWCARRDLFPTDTWMEARSDYFERWSPTSTTIAHATKLRNWVISNEYYREEFGSDWKLSREQMFYYELEKEDAIRRNALHTFLKEKPSDPEEAFQHAGQTIYPIQTLLNVADRAQSKIPDVYKLRGDQNEISPEYFPALHEIKDNGNIIQIRANWNSAIAFSDFELVQINFEGWGNFDPTNKFLIWEYPQAGASYGMSHDSSDGLGMNISDDAIIEIIKKGTIEYKDKQVLEFGSNEIPPNMFWPFALAAATLYSPEEQLLFIPEINKGTELLTAMEKRGWANIFQMLDMRALGKGFTQGTKFGFETNNRTRPDLIGHMNSFLLGDWVEIYSMLLLGELKDLIKKRTVSPQLGSINDKILGKKDNRFMAFAICLYALHRDSILGLEKAAWEERTRNENSKVQLKSYRLEPYMTDEKSEIVYNSDEDIEGEMELIGVSDEGY